MQAVYCLVVLLKLKGLCFSRAARVRNGTRNALCQKWGKWWVVGCVLGLPDGQLPRGSVCVYVDLHPVSGCVLGESACVSHLCCHRSYSALLGAAGPVWFCILFSPISGPICVRGSVCFCVPLLPPRCHKRGGLKCLPAVKSRAVPAPPVPLCTKSLLRGTVGFYPSDLSLLW